MLRKLLLPALAAAALAGCATGYQYRGGQGDYYYGQPQVEYRHSGSSGFYGDVGFGYGSGGFGGFGYGFGASYFYDRFGRLVYGYPSRYYGSSYYGYGGGYPHRHPRRHHGGNYPQGDSDNDQDRRPPWRGLGQLQPPNPDEPRTSDRQGGQAQDIGSRQAPFSQAPVRAQRAINSAPMVREQRQAPSSASRMSGSSEGGARVRESSRTRVDD